MNNMYKLFELGDILHGYCNGYFGRDDYKSKTCILVRPKFAVFEYENEEATILNLSECEGLTKKDIEEWKEEVDHDEEEDYEF